MTVEALFNTTQRATGSAFQQPGGPQLQLCR
jgi:hypothetical protein